MICKLALIHIFLLPRELSDLSFMVFNCFCRHAFDDSWKYFEVFKMAQPHIILWWLVIGRSWGGAKEQSIVSLIITSFALACLAPTKPPPSDEAMIPLRNCHMEHSSKIFATLRFTPDSASVISKVSWYIVDSRTFENLLSTQIISVSMPC